MNSKKTLKRLNKKHKPREPNPCRVCGGIHTTWDAAIYCGKTEKQKGGEG